MSNYAIQRNMVTMTQHEFNRIMSDLELYMKSSKIADERIKLLEDQLRATEKELKELQAKQAADELLPEGQKLGLYGSDFIG